MSLSVGPKKNLVSNWVVCGKRASGKSRYVFETLTSQLPNTTCIFVLSDNQTTREQWTSFPKTRIPMVVSTPNVELLGWLTLQTNVSIVLDDLTKKPSREFWEVVSTFARFNKTPSKLTLIVQDLSMISPHSNLSSHCDVLVFIGTQSHRNDKLTLDWNASEVRYVKSKYTIEKKEASTPDSEDLEEVTTEEQNEILEKNKKM
jgi:hypothetical protein